MSESIRRQQSDESDRGFGWTQWEVFRLDDRNQRIQLSSDSKPLMGAGAEYREPESYAKAVKLSDELQVRFDENFGQVGAQHTLNYRALGVYFRRAERVQMSLWRGELDEENPLINGDSTARLYLKRHKHHFTRGTNPEHAEAVQRGHTRLAGKEAEKLIHRLATKK
ncbi:hypothetical protein ACFL2C_04345 [Patescibacteria group bacterium]